MATQSSGFGAARNNAERKAISGSDTGGNSGDTAARPNVVSNINSNLMVQDKATKRWIPLQFDATGGTGITVTLSGGAFRDAEGLPANVAAAAAYGTSAFAARRDHVHTIGAGVVTGTMIANTTITNANITNATIDLTTKVTGALPTLNGGTGAALTPAIGDILYATSSTTMARLADVATGNALISGGVTTAPSWGKIGLTTHVSGTLPETSGGTNQTTYTTGDLLYASGSNTLAKLADVATGNALISGGVGVIPSWGKVGLTTHVSGTLPETSGGTGQATYTAGDILYASAANTLAKLPDVAAGSWLRSGGVGVAPAWSAPTLPNTATLSKLLFGNGTNWIESTVSFPSSTGSTANTFMRGGGPNIITESTLTLQNSAAGGRPLISDASNSWNESTGYLKKTTTYTVAAGDCEGVIDCDATSGAFTVNLPAATVGLGFRVTIRKLDSSANAITITPNGTDGIDGTNVSHKLNAQFSKMVLRATGAAGASAGQGWVVESAEDYLSASASAVTDAGSAAYHSLASITLTPGEWDISACTETVVAGGATMTQVAININSSTGAGTVGDNQLDIYQSWTATQRAAASIPSYKVSVTAATQTWQVNYNNTWATTAPTVYGRISARRVR